MKNHYYSSVLLVLLTACSPVRVGGGDGGTNGYDASAGDGGTTPDAGPGLVTARVYDMSLSPLPNAKVSFNAADGSAISVKVTDANGEASEMMYPGGMVSAAMIQSGSNSVQYQVMTIMGAMPGDVIEFGPRTKQPTYNNLGTAGVRFANDYSTADHYFIGNGCSQLNLGYPQPSGYSTYNFQDDRCSGTSTNYDLLGLAFDNANNVLAWTVITDVAAGSGNTYVSDPWNTSFNQLNGFFTNVPFAGTVGMSNEILHKGVTYDTNNNPPDMMVGAGESAAFAIPVPSGFPARMMVSFNANSTTNSQLIAYGEMVDGSATTLTVDASKLGYPAVDNVSVDQTTSRPTFDFTVDGAVPGTCEGTLAFAVWTNPDTTASPQEIWNWIVMAPPDATSPIQAPDLPSDFLTDPSGGNDRWPPPKAFDIPGLIVGKLELGDLAGWDEVRTKRGIGIVGDSGFLSPSAPIGAKTIISAGGLPPH